MAISHFSRNNRVAEPERTVDANSLLSWSHHDGVTKMRDVSSGLIIMKAHRNAARAPYSLRTLTYHGIVITTTYLPPLVLLLPLSLCLSLFLSLSLSLSLSLPLSTFSQSFFITITLTKIYVWSYDAFDCRSGKIQVVPKIMLQR